MEHTFKSWLDLSKLDHFTLLDDGRLALVEPGLDQIIDFHTHLGWTTLLAPPVDITRETPQTQHNYGRNLSVNLDIYSGENLQRVRPNWAYKDFAQCIFSPLRRGRHHTHTIPNLIKEMDALKIDRSVSLGLDMLGSDNCRRFGQAIRFNPRLVFYCMVDPRSWRQKKIIREYLDMGARGMKLHPEMQMAAPNSPQIINLVKTWQEISGGLPVLTHSGFNGFEPKAAREKAHIKNYWMLAEALKGSPCILGHAGMNSYREAIQIAEKHPHVWLEVSGQPPAHLQEMINRLGSERLLYGTDWPIYPQAISLAKVLIATEGNQQARINILRDNARRLLDKD